MTTIGQVLDEFFSPFSSEKLWIMPESDNYTKIVMEWQPVIEATNRTKLNLATDCANWGSNFMTDPGWRPLKTDAPKANSYREFVPSPPGTDPRTCQEAFVIYVSSKVVKNLYAPPVSYVLPEIQMRKLYTYSIGSFSIYTTVDRIDCDAKTATMNYWMYNAMSKRSFGRFASHPAFALSRMATQYMWWNWGEAVEWSSGVVKRVSRAVGARRW